jgi:hypothetical protein|tara:strand:+ start:1059 stop:1265 length:207 start_codon:yes stop_codon:yes gene_type:complete
MEIKQEQWDNHNSMLARVDERTLRMDKHIDKLVTRAEFNVYKRLVHIALGAIIAGSGGLTVLITSTGG